MFVAHLDRAASCLVIPCHDKQQQHADIANVVSQISKAHKRQKTLWSLIKSQQWQHACRPAQMLVAIKRRSVPTTSYRKTSRDDITKII